ncbi:MAG: hypothetical protein AAB504_00200 [Patescibacteria group bacterium]
MKENSFSRFLLLFEILNFLINYDWFFWLVGKFNGRGWIKSVFLSYPANREYAKEYAYFFRMGSWEIRLSGFLRQNGKIIIMFSIFVVEEKEFLKKDNKEKMEEVVRHMEKIRRLVRADEKTFAGILPGLLSKRKIIDKSPEANLTALIVVEAVELVRKKNGLDEKIPIVVLGGRGFIGKMVVDKLKLVQKSDIYVVDLTGRDNKWPERETRKIIINVARHNTIGFYLDALREGDIILNEAYPGPSSEVISEIKSLNCDCFHVVGVEASAFPQFTRVYNGGIPCCAAWNADDRKIIIKKLT